jgi:hypothetical protein
MYLETQNLKDISFQMAHVNQIAYGTLGNILTYFTV